jgi:hypothetical protein
MDTLSKIAAVAFGAFLVFMLYRYLKANPESLSRENLTKSFGSMGFLALGLIVFIAVVVMLLRR